MTAEQFCYWLQGFAELSGDNPPTAEQWRSIREHIGTVFKKVTPHVLGPAVASPALDNGLKEYIRRCEPGKPIGIC